MPSSRRGRRRLTLKIEADLLREARILAAGVPDLDLTDQDTVREAYARTDDPAPPAPQSFRDYYRNRLTFEQEADAAEEFGFDDASDAPATDDGDR